MGFKSLGMLWSCSFPDILVPFLERCEFGFIAGTGFKILLRGGMLSYSPGFPATPEDLFASKAENEGRYAEFSTGMIPRLVS